MARNPRKPTCISILICDDVYRDEITKKLVVVGTFNRINAESFPCKHGRVVVLFSITDGQGEYELSLSIEHERSGVEVARIRGPITIHDPLAIHDINVTLDKLQFVEPGKYWVMVKVDGEIIQQRPFFVMPRQDVSRKENAHG
jgi:hypothetical protein